MVELYADHGTTSDPVEAVQNVAGVETPVLRISPERGTFLRILNNVAAGSAKGVPIYAEFNDSNGDPLPTNTRFWFALKMAGKDQPLQVSETIGNISEWNVLDLTEQRDSEKVDSVKVNLQTPETAPNGGQPMDSLDVRYIDEARVMMDSATAIDWSKSSFYVDKNAAKGTFQMG